MRALLRSPLTAGLVASALVFAALMALRITGNLEYLELAAYDWQIRMRPPASDVTPRIVIVHVTENDISKLKEWPLSDAILAHSLAKLARYGPRAIIVDIYRDVPVPPGYEQLEEVLGRYKQIIGAMKFPSPGTPGVAPPDALKGTEQVGFADIPVDSGGIVRRALLILDDGKTVAYSMDLRAVLLYLHAAGIAVQGDPENPEHIRFGSTTFRPFESNDGGYVGADAGGYQFLIDYRDRKGVFSVLTLDQLLEGFFDPAILKDKVILMGVAAESVKDFFYTPYSRENAVYGVTLHAHIVSQLLRAAIDGDKPIAVIADRIEALWIFLWCLLGGGLALLIPSAWRFALAAVAGLIVLTAIVQGLFVLGWWIPLVPPAFGWVASAALVMAYVSSQEKRQRANLMNLFSSYTSEKLATAIWEDREKFLSGGRPRPQKLTATAFFTDVASFTTVSEKLDPQMLMDWLSDFMDTVTPIVSESGGVILRFIGDSIMAVFGVPIARTSEAEIRQDAINAVECALAIQERLCEHNRGLQQRGLPLIGMRIGILTGPMVAGSLGSARRLEYNVHGDTVNTASRLESFDKEGFAPDYFETPCRILVGEPTVKLVGDQFETKLLGEVRLKGKSEATPIYQVVGRKAADAKPAPGKKTPAPAPAATGATDLVSARGELQKKGRAYRPA